MRYPLGGQDYESEPTFAKKPEATMVAYKKETQKRLFNSGAAGTVRASIIDRSPPG
jgi:hypothetical protein